MGPRRCIVFLSIAYIEHVPRTRTNDSYRTERPAAGMRIFLKQGAILMGAAKNAPYKRKPPPAYPVRSRKKQPIKQESLTCLMGCGNSPLTKQKLPACLMSTGNSPLTKQKLSARLMRTGNSTLTEQNLSACLMSSGNSPLTKQKLSAFPIRPFHAEDPTPMEHVHGMSRAS